ncbi:hypothetical protein F2P81_020985 [Scophthalmus maximus]|uniref:Uncharacterized protein n=1 Tax=Scophthalmus maximus TaxID=52904 RepID=A0A6A4S259_SCOMX|nr:hypothetical protein F2P81_020985 [Scophthalmus maximus]
MCSSNPGLVDTPVDGATGLLPRQRVEFPALDTTGPIGSTSPGIPTCFRTLSTSEDGAWHGDLNVRRWEDDGAGREASLRGSKVDGGRDSDGQLTRPNQYPGPLS